MEQIPNTKPAEELEIFDPAVPNHVVLIVDDEEENLDLLISTLRRGNEIHKAHSAEEALEYLRQNDVHMVITDHRMPGITGVELLSKLKATHPLAIRILITGYTDSKIAVDAINEGEVHRYIQKPWDPKELQMIVGMELERFDLRYKARRLTEDLIRANQDLRSLNKEMLRQKQRAEKLAAEYKQQKEIALDMSQRVALANRELLKAQEEIKTQNRKLESVNKKLERLSVTDGLTGFYNHRQMHFILENEIGRARRYDLRLSVMMVDLDYFKEINDNFGHQAGDLVLRTAADIIRENIRDTDMPTRYGGDEFLLILPHTGLDKALYLGKRIHEQIAAFEFKTETGEFRQTVSVGIACFPNSRAQNKDSLVKLVDEALYQAKEAGRNRVAVYREDE